MATQRELVIGIDFDNTVAIYDDLFRTLAAEQGLIAPGITYDKRELRDAIRHLPDGDAHWQKLQAAAYGPRIAGARLAAGAGGFLARCAGSSVPVHIVSHKTELASYDETNTSLRLAAIDWMRAAGVFESRAITPERVYFGATRQEKIEYIRSLGCTHYIDDLEEVFGEPTFPAKVVRILYQPKHAGPSVPGARVAASWNQIGEWLFGDGN